jgi:hypothetical protein
LGIDVLNFVRIGIRVWTLAITTTETRVIKAMRGRIALQSTACEIYARCPFRFAPAFGVRARLRAAFGNYPYDGNIKDDGFAL